MSLKQESYDVLFAELQRRVNKVPQVVGLDAYGVTAADMGMDSEFIHRVINEAYLAVFTAEEVEEMTAYQLRFQERTLILERLVEEAVAKVIESNKDSVVKKLEEGIAE